ncbi:MAG: 2-amino-4-hydroxy-6-hydroxymethyldihydropteridine [Desulfobulbaceae bacterium]|jgi:2-amino-4-hydroxy-6-hydroxymethyldihydropteridine diphosphokinase|nr:MAG: 2-amino-4-hydroxy-6-hydroxymethyldihydropteridine [Desulfobulbaceae bacterium]
MTRAYIGFGSNLGNGKELVLSAWMRLAIPGKVVLLKLSSLYVTEAVGLVSQSLFTNAVGEVETDLQPFELLHLLLAVEKEHGRQRDVDVAGYQDRTLDLDLLYFGATVCSTSELTLPHPRLADRLFVLVPLAEIAPDFQDPVTGITMKGVAQQLLLRIAQGAVPPQSISQIENSVATTPLVCNRGNAILK